MSAAAINSNLHLSSAMSDWNAQPPESDAGPMAEEVPSAPAAAPAKPGKKQYARIEPFTPEAMMQEEFMNNCATRTALSGVMGLGLGVLFGIVMGSMDGTVRRR